ncbi:hypothetical protein Nepgr_003820 [Nepenthes gracilis]|uniref:DUF7054 domain-containing protein n=1 Tax=Nepenthes gracilis TaxID=150966 RepID=A0AAD3XEH8_NEPGR|nr:hypothetical protein Nepgr_003820 [Nepenthes gracilis]
MVLYRPKKAQNAKGNRFLITVNVLGSTGPMRFVVNELEPVSAVIDMVLKSYAREGRLPVLGTDPNDFLLYCPSAGSDALSPLEKIGAHGARIFMLCKKPQSARSMGDERPTTAIVAKKGAGSWRTWINKSLSLKVSPP